MFFLQVYGICEKLDVKNVFNLFSIYGNVLRVIMELFFLDLCFDLRCTV